MRLSHKIALLQIVQIILFVISIGFLVYFFAGSTVAKWEQENVRDAVVRVESAWDDWLESLSSTTADWGSWNEAYDFAGNPEEPFFTKNNLSASAIVNVRANGVAFIDLNANIFFARAANLTTKEENPINQDLLEVIRTTAVDKGRLLSEGQNVSGFMMYQNTPVLFSVHHILASENKGPARGYIVMYRIADEEFWRQISEKTRTTVHGPAELLTGNEQFDKVLFRQIRQEDKIELYITMNDAYGIPAFSLALETPRNMYHYGKERLWQLLLLAVLFMLFTSMIFLFVLHKMLDCRIVAIDQFMKSVLTTQNLSARLKLPGNDELARVAATMNAMLDKIEKSSQENQDLYKLTQYEIRERMLIEQNLRYQSTHDVLTGAYNRTYFEEYLANLEEKDRSIGIIFCDVDGLKLINDSLGHECGDQVLRTVARIIEETLPQDAVTARIGGDEFVILLQDVTDVKMKKIVDRLRATIEASHTNNLKEIFSVAIGWSATEKRILSKDQIRMTVKRADDNMYRQKLARENSTRHVLIQGMMEMLKVRDFLTEGHSQRLQQRITLLAKKIGLHDTQITDLTLLAQFHDVGKVGVSDAILFKKGGLTPEEKSEMQRHSEIGFRIAQSVPELIPISDLILKHHEWWDGTGYPLGLQGGDIPVEDRILAIADAYDAMTNDRPYRKAMSADEGFKELLLYSAKQFDPSLVELFIEIVKEENALQQLG
ncbi:MAG: diguanylate cyclase with sensor [Firmicutes bacterium]|nr:diguanylate cyclase with sensor [Bacillota bacterium]